MALVRSRYRGPLVLHSADRHYRQYGIIGIRRTVYCGSCFACSSPLCSEQVAMPVRRYETNIVTLHCYRVGIFHFKCVEYLEQEVNKTNRQFVPIFANIL